MQLSRVLPGEHKTITLTESGEYLVELTGPNARVEIKGAFSAKGEELVNVHLTIVHKAPHTQANTVLKGVARDSSFIKFFGLIKIEPNCGDSQSFLEERILLLSDKARAEAVPELEILTDDVKCSHAASISQIPEQELFYLQSRGIPKTQAENMIIEGFLK